MTGEPWYYVCPILLVKYVYPSEYEEDLLLCEILHNTTEEKKLAFRLFSTNCYIEPADQERDQIEMPLEYSSTTDGNQCSEEGHGERRIGKQAQASQFICLRMPVGPVLHWVGRIILEEPKVLGNTAELEESRQGAKWNNKSKLRCRWEVLVVAQKGN